MYGGERSNAKAAAWSADANRAGAAPRRRNGPRIIVDDGATSVRAVIVSSLFFILLAASLLFGGHAAIDPLLRSVMAGRGDTATGDFVYALPDGKFCRHMSFNNATSEIVEGTIQRCPDDMVREHFRDKGKGFAWGEH
jgi:hypothetical protein